MSSVLLQYYYKVLRYYYRLYCGNTREVLQHLLAITAVPPSSTAVLPGGSKVSTVVLHSTAVILQSYVVLL